MTCVSLNSRPRVIKKKKKKVDRDTLRLNILSKRRVEYRGTSLIRNCPPPPLGPP